MVVNPRPRDTLRVGRDDLGTWTVRLHRPDAANSLTPQLIDELSAVLQEAEQAGVAVLAVRGTSEVFSTGMDLVAAVGESSGQPSDGTAFWSLLSALRVSPVLVVAVVEGRAAGGGLGLVAASDVVIAGPRSSFALPEALWGLLPCCVAPFLVERVGPRLTRLMALQTTPVTPDEALRWGLVDQVVTDPDQALRRLALRQSRIAGQVRGRLKRFLTALPARPHEARDCALGELSDVMATQLVGDNLRRYAQSGVFPWEA